MSCRFPVHKNYHIDETIQKQGNTGRNLTSQEK